MPFGNHMIKKLGTPGTTTVKSGFYWAACTRCCTNTWYKTWYRRGTWSVRLTQRAGEGVMLLPKEPISQVLSGSNPELGKLANKLANKFDLLGRLISVVQCILL